MSNSDDEFDTGRQQEGGEEPYKVGNKRPPLHSRFKPGQSGNRKGRPKGRSDFDRTFLQEFNKPVTVIMNGKPVKITNDKLFAVALVKDGIMKGPQAKALVLKFVQQQEAREAAAAEARKKVEPFGPVKDFSWTEEQEKLFRKLERATKRLPGQENDPDQE